MRGWRYIQYTYRLFLHRENPFQMFNESEIPHRSNGPLLSPIDIVNLSDTRTALSSCWGKEGESPNGCHQSVSLCSLWKPHYLAPCHERLLTEHAIMGGSHQMSSTAKQIVDRTMSREKTLGLSGGLEATHLPFLLPRRLTREFRTVVLSVLVQFTN